MSIDKLDRSQKHHETGRRISVKNEESDPVFIDCPHLAHVTAVELDEVNVRLDEQNRGVRRKTVNGLDPLYQQPRKRTRFPGQYARCWYCGHQYVWGGNGITRNLMCSGSREWHCWNSIGFDGELSAKRIVEAITAELYELEGFESQFTEMVGAAMGNRSGDLTRRWEKLLHNERALETAQGNLVDAIAEYGPRKSFEKKVRDLDMRQKELAIERYHLENLRHRELCLPRSVGELRDQLLDSFRALAIGSPEFGDLLHQLVPEFHVYAVRLCDGGHLMPRARIRLDLAGHVVDAEYVPDLKSRLSRVLTIDLFERPPQRERIREEVVRLSAAGATQREISRQLTGEKPKLPTIQRALALDQTMRDLGLDTPYIVLQEPPDDYPKLRRHKNAKYAFRRLKDYEPPML